MVMSLFCMKHNNECIFIMKNIVKIFLLNHEVKSDRYIVFVTCVLTQEVTEEVKTKQDFSLIFGK